MQIEIKLRKYLVILALVVGIFLSVAAIQGIKAQLFFQGDNQCSVTDAVDCPFGSKRQNEGRTSSDFACIPSLSEFCSLLTNSPVAAHDSNNRQYCVGIPLPNVGTCIRANKLIGNIPITGLGVDAYEYRYINITDPTSQKVKNSLHEIFGNNSYYVGLLGNKEQLACIELESDGNKELKIWLPRFSDRLDVSSGDDNGKREYQNIDQVSRIYKAVTFGISLIRGDSEPKFCEDPNAVYVRPDGADESEGVCYQGVGNRPCLIPSVRGGGQECVTGINYGGDPFVPIYQHYKGSDDSYSRYVAKASIGSNLCKKNSKDLLEASTNKGCADYLEVNNANNFLQFKGTNAANNPPAGATSDQIDRLKADAKKNETAYGQCVKCLYGDSKFTVDNIRDEKFDKNFPKLDPAGVNPVVGDAIKPENEVFARPLQGHFFSDLGCINTIKTESIINTVIRFALAIMSVLVILRIIQGAVMLQQVSGADPEAVQEGKAIITSALIALLLLIFSAALLNFLGINVLQLGKQGFNPIT